MTARSGALAASPVIGVGLVIAEGPSQVVGICALSQRDDKPALFSTVGATVKLNVVPAWPVAAEGARNMRAARSALNARTLPFVVRHAKKLLC